MGYLFKTLICLSVIISISAFADVKLPSIYGSHMVLQRNRPIKIRGWADPGESVTVELAGKKAIAATGPDGNWQVELPAMKAGGPYTVSIQGKNKLKLDDVLIGEVWICSGQSNMEWRLYASKNGKKEVANAKFPKIRLFDVPRRPCPIPAKNINSKWLVCSPATVGPFSAVGYFFGRKLHKELNVPVGLIGSNRGGSRIEPWTPIQGFADIPRLKHIKTSAENVAKNYISSLPEIMKKIDVWAKENRKLIAEKKEPLPLPNISSATPSPGLPTVFFNGMIKPLLPFPIRGAIWYQGEANVYDGMLYFDKMKALISGWRKVWGQGDFPFYYAQLAPYKRYRRKDALPMLWEAQRASLSIPNTGMAATIDIGNFKDIHPKNKQDIGKRLALWALANTYGKKELVFSGPMFKSMQIKGNKAVISFDHVGGGLKTKGDKPLAEFEIAGKDLKFVKAKAEIKGDKVIVSSAEIPQPVAVRYCWSNTPSPNLINAEELPALPFRAVDGKLLR